MPTASSRMTSSLQAMSPAGLIPSLMVSSWRLTTGATRSHRQPPRPITWFARHRSAGPISHIPNFWSNQFGLNIKSVGLPMLADEVVLTQGSVSERRFVAVYGHKGRMVAALAVNMPRGLDAYEALIARKASFHQRSTRPMGQRPCTLFHLVFPHTDCPPLVRLPPLPDPVQVHLQRRRMRCRGGQRSTRSTPAPYHCEISWMPFWHERGMPSYAMSVHAEGGQR